MLPVIVVISVNALWMSCLLTFVNRSQFSITVTHGGFPHPSKIPAGDARKQPEKKKPSTSSAQLPTSSAKAHGPRCALSSSTRLSSGSNSSSRRPWLSVDDDKPSRSQRIRNSDRSSAGREVRTPRSSTSRSEYAETAPVCFVDSKSGNMVEWLVSMEAKLYQQHGHQYMNVMREFLDDELRADNELAWDAYRQ
ncbi:hypothetical protein BJ878DRAFT_575164 [Calycina marina]|uniref:Uncharacterized protein n=1 Tax=Calycina marina TaxID=1763456 RepID=A0A9P7Z4E1_9HELO|nr:hypothetical protein BJ878DRAFT_575164 [Calycina marina]